MMIVSFSGIDGAGKSTQISALEAWLNESGLRTTLLTFWDNVVCLSGSREFMSLKAFKGDAGVGSPEKPLQRRDKNVSSWPVTAMRFGLYFADAVNLCIRVRQSRNSGADVVIFDRYIYDELANLPLERKPTAAFARLILKLVPKPDLALVIDADPAAAHTRKPEYPLEFVRRNRESYLRLAGLSGSITVVEPDSVEAMKTTIRNKMLETLEQNCLRLAERYSAVSLPKSANVSPAELIKP
ncbi:MAG: thymidylate kinase [Candidatus Sulfotelmatobacter sp.]